MRTYNLDESRLVVVVGGERGGGGHVFLVFIPGSDSRVRYTDKL